MEEFRFTKLVVGDLEKAAAFYRDVYGLQEKNRIRAGINDDKIEEIVIAPEGAEGDFPLGSLILLRFIDQPAPVPGSIIVGITTGDLDSVLDRVRAHGGSVHAEPYSVDGMPMRVAFARDLEGNLAEIVEMPSDQE